MNCWVKNLLMNFLSHLRMVSLSYIPAKADFAVITVFDRIWMIDGDPPSVVAQWRGHIEMDRLAWKAAQVSEYYNHALLVIESNTLETNNTRSEAEYILNLVSDVYDNLYARESDNTSTDVKEKPPVRYGFHTNRLTKGTIIHNLKAVVREQLYTERDEQALHEYRVYQRDERGGMNAAQGEHDDRLMARAIGLYVSEGMPTPKQIDNSIFGRMRKRLHRFKKTTPNESDF